MEIMLDSLCMECGVQSISGMLVYSKVYTRPVLQ
jgi:hypothetical protein